MNNKKTLGTVTVIAAGILWGATGLFVNYLGTDGGKGFESLEITFFRVLFTFILLAGFLLIFNRSLFRVKLRDLWIFIGSGTASIAIFSYCYFYTIKTTSMSFAAVLLYTAPAIVIFLSAVIFKEKITVVKLIAAGVAFLGCVFVTGVLTGGLVFAPFGIITGLISGFCYALYSIFSRFALNRGYHPFTMTFYTFVFASVGMAVISAVNLPSTFQKISNDIPVLPMLVLFALVSAVLPYILYTGGLKYIDSGKASVMASVEPITASILGYFVLNQSLGISGILGIVLVVASIVLLNIKVKKDEG